MMTALTLALLLQPAALESTPAPDEVHVGVISGLTAEAFTLALDSGEYLSRVSLSVPMVWAYDGKTPVERWELAVGMHVKIVGASQWNVTRAEVWCLGPRSMEAVVEEWIIEAAGGKLSAGLSPSELAIVDALGSTSYFVRESVSRSLCEIGPRALRMLLWCRRSRDREVRARAEECLGRMGYQPSP